MSINMNDSQRTMNLCSCSQYWICYQMVTTKSYWDTFVVEDCPTIVKCTNMLNVINNVYLYWSVILLQAVSTLYRLATTSPMSAICILSNGLSPVQWLLGLTITDSVLISRGPNLVPGLLDVAVSTGTPTMQASSLSVS